MQYFLFYFALLSVLLMTFIPITSVCMEETLYRGELLHILLSSVCGDVTVKATNQGVSFTRRACYGTFASMPLLQDHQMLPDHALSLNN